MSAKVSRRARQHEDRAGDPLDGLVNLFDLGIVMAVAFLLAALASAKVTASQAQFEQQTAARDAIVVTERERVRNIQLRNGERAAGRGSEVGVVYRLSDGRTVIVEQKR